MAVADFHVLGAITTKAFDVDATKVPNEAPQHISSNANKATPEQPQRINDCDDLGNEQGIARAARIHPTMHVETAPMRAVADADLTHLAMNGAMDNEPDFVATPRTAAAATAGTIQATRTIIAQEQLCAVPEPLPNTSSDVLGAVGIAPEENVRTPNADSGATARRRPSTNSAIMGDANSEVVRAARIAADLALSPQASMWERKPPRVRSERRNVDVALLERHPQPPFNDAATYDCGQTKTVRIRSDRARVREARIAADLTLLRRV
jgi:hypothetical protein